MDDNRMNAVRRGETTHSLTYSFNRGMMSLRNVPELVLRAIEDNTWQDFIVECTGQPAHHEYLVDFITAPIPEGIGTTVEDLCGVCRLLGRDDVATRILERIDVEVLLNPECVLSESEAHHG